MPTLPPMRVPTLTEVVDWPPVQLVVVEGTALVQPHAHAEDAVEVCIDEAAELARAEPDVEPPNEPTPSLADVPMSDAPLHEPPPTPQIDEAALARRIFTDLQHQIDSMLDQQLRVAMQPLLNRLADTFALQAREELASALRDMVALAVSREMIRLRAAAPPSDSAGP